MHPDQLEAHPGAHYRMLPNPGGVTSPPADITDSSGGANPRNSSGASQNPLGYLPYSILKSNHIQ